MGAESIVDESKAIALFDGVVREAMFNHVTLRNNPAR